MSAEDKKKIELLATVVVALIALATALHGFVVLPYRMTSAEAAIKEEQIERVAAVSKVNLERQLDHDLLTKIDARTEEIQRSLVRLEKRP